MLCIFDTHAHYHDEAFEEDRDALLRSLYEGVSVPEYVSDGSDSTGSMKDSAVDPEKKSGGADDIRVSENKYRLGTIVDIAAEKDSLAKVMELVEKYPFVYGTMGLHPDEIADLTPETEEEIRKNLAHPKILAVGEIGLDYHWMRENKEIQIAGFKKQLAIAEEFGLPVVIHSREAAEDTLNVIKEAADGLKGSIRKRRKAENAGSTPLTEETGTSLATEKSTEPEAAASQKIDICPGIMHCYSYSVEHAREYVSMGFALGIGGVVTYKNAKKLKEVVREIPLENIVLETDCPYLAPTPFRGKRNDSGRLIYVAQAIAALKNRTVREVVRVTTENACRLYGISG